MIGIENRMFYRQIVAVGKCRRSLSLSYSKIFEVGGPSPKYLPSEKNTETNENCSRSLNYSLTKIIGCDTG